MGAQERLVENLALFLELDKEKVEKMQLVELDHKVRQKGKTIKEIIRGEF